MSYSDMFLSCLCYELQVLKDMCCHYEVTAFKLHLDASINKCHSPGLCACPRACISESTSLQKPKLFSLEKNSLKSKSTIKFLDQNKICLLSDWPPPSPDLNVIKNIWQILKITVHKHIPTNSVELWNIIKNEREKISRDIIIKAVRTII